MVTQCDLQKLRSLCAAHENAVAMLDDAIVATRATGLGRVPEALAIDLHTLQSVRDRVDTRLQRTTRTLHQVGDSFDAPGCA